MKPALFTDEDVAAVDREIAEASNARFADCRPSVGHGASASKAALAEDLDLAEDLAAELALEFAAAETGEGETGFQFEELPIPASGTAESRAEKVRRVDRAVTDAAMTLGWAIPAVAFSIGAALGNLQSDVAWNLAPAVVLAGTLLAKRRFRVPAAMPEFALCVHGVTLARAVSAAVASGSFLSSETAVAAAGAAVAVTCAAAIVHGRFFVVPATRGICPRQEPVFGGV